jgi:hypothetical protein
MCDFQHLIKHYNNRDLINQQKEMISKEEMLIFIKLYAQEFSLGNYQKVY